MVLFLAAVCAACSPSGEGPPEDSYRVSSLAELDALLSGLPENNAATPWKVILRGVDLRKLGGDKDGMAPLFNTFHGRYLSLDMDACTGATIGWGGAVNQNTDGRPNRDRLVAVVLPAPSTRIGYRNFQNTPALASARLPPHLETIGDAAFQGCSALEQIELPATLKHIADRAFEGCGNLKTVIVNAATPPGLGSGRYSPPIPVGGDPGVFTGLPPDFRILVPAGTKAAYRTASGWSFYRERIQERESL